MTQKIVIVGAGLAGVTVAEQLSHKFPNINILIIDRHNFVGGTSHSYRDKETGIDVHEFGPHTFHTNDKEVWDYVNQFSKFNQFQQHTLLAVRDKITTIPINLRTISDIFGYSMTPQMAKMRISDDIPYIKDPSNFEEKAISLVGRTLYKQCIEGYTRKQWNMNPCELPSGIITRLPVRFNYNMNYFNDRYQGIPDNGYDKMMENMLKSQNIELKLQTEYQDIVDQIDSDTMVFYSGMIDEFFNYRFGKLQYRSLRFEFERIDVDDYQGNSIINYGDIDIPYNRICEFKHFQPERYEIFNIGKTIICKQYPQDWFEGREAYYPIENGSNIEVLKKYQEYASATRPNFIFIGRLGKYRYFNMDEVIRDSIDICKEICLSK